jgi:alpha-beta hydrolase superfamily lysophospholipase
MEHQEKYFVNNKGLEIYYQGWIPEGPPRGVIIIVHGLHEHSGRYNHVGSFFSDAGYAVYGLDFPGHGKSSGIRSYVDSFDDFTDTLQTFKDLVHGWHPSLPVFLMGHSLGGLIASVYLLDHQDQVQGAILSGSLVRVPDYVNDFTIRLGRTLSSVLPKFRILGIDIDGISRDPEVVQAYRDDPLVYTGKMTARISDAMNRGIDRLAREGSKVRLPLLLLHGSEDRLCDPAWSEYLRDLVSSPDKELHIYQGLFHEVYNEPEADMVFRDVLKWLEERTS